MPRVSARLSLRQNSRRPNLRRCLAHSDDVANWPVFFVAIVAPFPPNSGLQGALLVLPRVSYSNFAPRVHAPYMRWSDPNSPHMAGMPEGPFEDARGACKPRIETAQTFLTPTMVAELAADYSAGVPMDSLVEKYAVNEQTARLHARKAGAVRSPRVSPDVLVEYAAGVPSEELAARCGVSAETVMRHARMAGVCRGRLAPAQDQVIQIVELYQQGMSMAQIGSRVGMGNRKVKQLLTDAGVRIRPWGRAATLWPSLRCLRLISTSCCLVLGRTCARGGSKSSASGSTSAVHNAENYLPDRA